MPALYLFGKRTLLAGDDLQPPAILIIGARVLQVVCLTLPLSLWLLRDAEHSGESLVYYLITDPSHDATCVHSHYYPLFTSLHLMATVLFGIVSVVMEWQIWHWTCQGTPTIREPRSTKVQLWMERILSYLTIGLMGIVFLYFTGIGFAQTYLTCHAPDDASQPSPLWIGTNAWWIFSVLLIFSQVSELVLISLFLARLLLQPDDTGDGVWNNHTNHHHHRTQTQELWTDRCHWMCKCLSISTCCLFGGQDLMENHNPAVSTNNIYQQVAIALAEYLETRGTLDIVPSDLITGLLMLQKLQEQRKLQAQIQVIRSSRQQSFTTVVDDGGPGIQMETTSSSNSSSQKSLTRRRNTPEPQSKASAFGKRVASSGSLSASGSSSSSLMGLVETSQLVPPMTSQLDSLRRNIYRRVSSSSLHYAPRARQVLDPNNLQDQDSLQEGARMAKYALAIYTWMLYVFVHPLSGFPNILCMSCQLCCRSKPSYRNRGTDQGSSSLLSDDEELWAIGDNLCHWHKSALLLVAQLDHTDLVYAQFENRFSLMPYCILLDHETQCVIISIRGSLSLEDLVTDALIDPESCEGLGEEFGFDARGQYCHAGVVACVNNIYQDLERHRLLDSLAEDFPNYGLRLVGHSLGAASATLLGYMLKNRYNDLKVFNFSPPGCTMTWELATQCREWTTTFVLDSDIVPRLSVLAMEELRDEVLQLVGKLKVPKYQVFESIFSTLMPGQYFRQSSSSSSEPNEVDLEQNLTDLNRKISEMIHDGETADTVYHRQLQEFLRIQEELKRSRGDSRTMRLYPPGRMIHLLKTGEDSGCSHTMKKCVTCCMSNSGFRYTPIYISNDDLNEIVVCPTMGTDHFVDRMYFELQNVASQFERRYQEESTSR